MLLKSHALWNDFAEVQNDFDRFFRWGFSPRTGDIARGYYPPANIMENDDAYTIEARIPGLAKEDISVELEGRKLTLRGEHKRTEGAFSREERATGKFERSFTFKHALANDSINAEVKDGVLTIILPKAEEAKARKIEIVAK